MITGRFAQILQDHRARYNARFAEARRYYSLLEPDTFSAHLTRTLAPIVEAISTAAPDRVESAAEELYDLSLNLVGREFLGPNSRYPAIQRGWEVLLPRFAQLVAQQPTQVAGAITNALHTLSKEPGTRPLAWIQLLSACAPACESLDILMKAGQVAAWRAGMAHYRLSALDLCIVLPGPVVLQLLGLPDTDQMAKRIPPLIDQLRANPWLHPSRAFENQPASQLKILAQAGGFRGFGGRFVTLPLVTGLDGPAFLIQENGSTWRLYADCFGATLIRSEPTVQTELIHAGNSFRLSIGGEVQCGLRQRVVFKQLQHATGSAENGSTLAVTTQYSHWIYLVGLA